MRNMPDNIELLRLVAGRSVLRQETHSLEELSEIAMSPCGEGRIMRVVNGTGEGSMTFYEVMPGVMLTYNDFRMEACESGFSLGRECFSVNHCRDGRLEQLLPGGGYSYLAHGDLKLADLANHAGRYVFPLAHYQGIAIAFDIDVCEEPIGRVLGGFPVSVRALKERFCRNNVPYVLHDFSDAEQIFSGLYSVDPALRKPYAQVKILELLLLLSHMDYREDNQRIRYFHKSHVERVKEARDIMMADLMETCTVEELARRMDMPITAFKACFKGVYGMPPYAYLRAYRMERAAEALVESDSSVAEIGMEVGYDSPSKFTAAFKAVMGETPTRYRQQRR